MSDATIDFKFELRDLVCPSVMRRAAEIAQRSSAEAQKAELDRDQTLIENLRMFGQVLGRKADECPGVGWQKAYSVRFYSKDGERAGWHRNDWFAEDDLELMLEKDGI